MAPSSVPSGRRKIACCSHQLPPGLVDQGVVVTAEEYQVVDVGFSAVGPVDDVVDVAPAVGMVTVGEHAVQVPGHHCDPLG